MASLYRDLARYCDVIYRWKDYEHLKTYARLERAIHNIGRHLVPGGVAILEPWFTREAYAAGTPRDSTGRREVEKN